MEALRAACGAIAERGRFVRIDKAAIPAYAASLPLTEVGPRSTPGSGPERADTTREGQAAFWLTLDAINFGSGWFPTLDKRRGQSGYDTIAAAVDERFAVHGPWSPRELQELRPEDVARTVHQHPGHELMALFAASLRDLGRRVEGEHDGSFAALADIGRPSAVALALHLGSWDCFADCSRFGELEVPFLKRAQIAAGDLARAGVIAPPDLNRLTMFADNLVPHVLRLDGILWFDPQLVRRIEHEELIEHGSREEVEIRACALHAVELIVAERPGSCAAQVDELLWNRGRDRRYKAVPRHRSRSTAY